VTIESAVLEALGGGPARENTLFRALFGLLFWDVIFAPVPGMFQHRFQTGPLDLASEHFYENRRSLIVAKLAELQPRESRPQGAHRVRALLRTHERPRRLGPLHAEELSRAADAFGERLVPILERLARHPSRHGRGLPDLLVFENGYAGARRGQGPGDQPQIEHGACGNDALLAVGVDVRIARVRRQRE
jgi:Fanconi-associated nuclease 1